MGLTCGGGPLIAQVRSNVNREERRSSPVSSTTSNGAPSMVSSTCSALSSGLKMLIAWLRSLGDVVRLAGDGDLLLGLEREIAREGDLARRERDRDLAD